VGAASGGDFAFLDENFGYTPAVPSARLVRVLGAGVGVAVGVGTTIGAGILGAPSDVAKSLPDATWILAVWIVGALYAFLGANSMAEVATVVARSGGFTPIARRTLGPYAGFVVGWLDFASGCGSVAAQALLLAINAAVIVPLFADSPPIVAGVVLVAMAALQWRGVQVGARAQIAMSVLKAAAFLAIVVACFVSSSPASSATAPAMPEGFALAKAVAVALQGVIFTYDGWYSAIYLGEEVKDPGKAIPKSLFTTVAAVGSLYVLINIGLLARLGAANLGATKTPFSDVAALVVGGAANKVIAGLVVLSLMGALNATLLGTPRVLFAMASDGVVPKQLVATTKGGTPWITLILTVVVAIVFLVSGTFERVTGSLSVLMVGMYASVFLGVLVLRRREPNIERPFRARAYPWLTWLGLLLSIAFIAATVVEDTPNALIGAVILVLSVPAYFAQKKLSRQGQLHGQ
jgi:APA family basic amino acid/polyamine antiporter